MLDRVSELLNETLGAAWFLCREELKLCLENALHEYLGGKSPTTLRIVSPFSLKEMRPCHGFVKSRR